MHVQSVFLEPNNNFGHIHVMYRVWFRMCSFREFFIDNFRNQVKHFRSTIAQLIVAC